MLSVDYEATVRLEEMYFAYPTRADAPERKPNVPILDQHSAALISESERAVVQAVKTTVCALGTTVITITHHKSLLRRADRVAMLVDRCLGEVAMYDSLMRNKQSHLRRMFVPVSVDDDTHERDDTTGSCSRSIGVKVITERQLHDYYYYIIVLC